MEADSVARESSCCVRISMNYTRERGYQGPPLCVLGRTDLIWRRTSRYRSSNVSEVISLSLAFALGFFAGVSCRVISVSLQRDECTEKDSGSSRLR